MELNIKLNNILAVVMSQKKQTKHVSTVVKKENNPQAFAVGNIRVAARAKISSQPSNSTTEVWFAAIQK